MAGSPNLPNLATRSPRRLPRRLAPRTVPDLATAAAYSCAMNTQPCFEALSGIGRMRRFGGTAGGVSTRFRGFEDRIRKLGAFGTWLCCVLLIGLGVSPAAIAQTTVTYIHTDALGSVVAESDANGNVIKRYDYEPYGALVGDQVTDGSGVYRACERCGHWAELHAAAVYGSSIGEISLGRSGCDKSSKWRKLSIVTGTYQITPAQRLIQMVDAMDHRLVQLIATSLR